MFCFTFSANPEKGEGVTFAVVFFALRLKRVVERGGDFFVPDLAAYGAGAVTVKRYIRVVSVSVLTYGHLDDLTRGYELFQIAVDGRESDIGQYLFAFEKDIFRRRVFFRRPENA